MTDLHILGQLDLLALTTLALLTAAALIGGLLGLAGPR